MVAADVLYRAHLSAFASVHSFMLVYKVLGAADHTGVGPHESPQILRIHGTPR